MYKVSIPVLELALKNQKQYKLELEKEIARCYPPSSTLYKKQLRGVKKSISQLKEILGK